MSTVISRSIRSVPYRSALGTWQRILDVLTAAGGSGPRATLESIAGIASAIITEKSPQESPIVVLGGGPRVRIYCLYDDSAIEDDSHSEQVLSFNPFDGDWSVSLPCPAADLGWVATALAQKTQRVRARDAAEGIAVPATESRAALEIDVGEFMKS